MTLADLVRKMGRSALPVRHARIQLTPKACKAFVALERRNGAVYRAFDWVMSDLALAIRVIDPHVLPHVERTTSPRVKMYDKATGEMLYIVEKVEDEFVIYPAEGRIGGYAPGHILRAYVKNLNR